MSGIVYIGKSIENTFSNIPKVKPAYPDPPKCAKVWNDESQKWQVYSIPLYPNSSNYLIYNDKNAQRSFTFIGIACVGRVYETIHFNELTKSGLNCVSVGKYEKCIKQGRILKNVIYQVAHGIFKYYDGKGLTFKTKFTWGAELVDPHLESNELYPKVISKPETVKGVKTKIGFIMASKYTKTFILWVSANLIKGIDYPKPMVLKIEVIRENGSKTYVVTTSYQTVISFANTKICAYTFITCKYIKDVENIKVNLYRYENGWVLEDSKMFTIVKPKQYAKIVGIVVDENGNPIDGADVIVGDYSVKTINGKFVIDCLTPGTYTLKVSKSGYMTFTEKIVIKQIKTYFVKIVLKRIPMVSPYIGLAAVLLSGFASVYVGFNSKKKEVMIYGFRRQGFGNCRNSSNIRNELANNTVYTTRHNIAGNRQTWNGVGNARWRFGRYCNR